MTEKTLPFDQARIRDIIRNYPTPFYLYDERGIRQNARRLNAAFSWSEGFKEYFAVKATPNPHILKIAREEGFGADCSSLPELALSERVGILGENIMFTSNDTPSTEYTRAKELGAIINLDDNPAVVAFDKNLDVTDALLVKVKRLPSLPPPPSIIPPAKKIPPAPAP